MKNFPYIKNNFSQCDRGPICSWIVLEIMFLLSLINILISLINYSLPFSFLWFALSNFTCFRYSVAPLPGAIPWLVFEGNSQPPIYKLLFKLVHLWLTKHFPVLWVNFITTVRQKYHFSYFQTLFRKHLTVTPKYWKQEGILWKCSGGGCKDVLKARNCFLTWRPLLYMSWSGTN